VELLQLRLVEVQLLAAPRAPVQGVEGQDHRAAPEVGKADEPALRVGKGEVWSPLPYGKLRGHPGGLHLGGLLV